MKSLVLWEIDAAVSGVNQMASQAFSNAIRLTMPAVDGLNLAMDTSLETELSLITKTVELAGVEQEERSYIRHLLLQNYVRCFAHLRNLMTLDQVSPHVRELMAKIFDEGIGQTFCTRRLGGIAVELAESLRLTAVVGLELGAFGQEALDFFDLVDIAKEKYVDATEFEIENEEVCILSSCQYDVDTAIENGYSSYLVLPDVDKESTMTIANDVCSVMNRF